MFGSTGESITLPFESLVMWSVFIDPANGSFAIDITLDATFKTDSASGDTSIEWWTGKVLDVRVAVPDAEIAKTMAKNLTDVCMLIAQSMDKRVHSAKKALVTSKVGQASQQLMEGQGMESISTMSPQERRAKMSNIVDKK